MPIVMMQCAELGDLFSSLRESFGGVGEFYAKQAGLLKERFGTFFVYYHNELESLKAVYFMNFLQLSAFQTKMCSDYLKREELLYSKKERLFSEGKVLAWDLSPEDAKGEDGLKVQTDKALAMKLMLSKVTLNTNARKLRNSKNCT